MPDNTLIPYDPDREDAEVVEVTPAALGGPVDADDTREPLYATITGIRDQERAPIVPAWLRNHDQRVQFARWAVGLAAYVVAFHTVRSPKYAAKTAIWSPLGLLRAIGRALHWASAEEGNWSLRQHAANTNNPAEWRKLDHIRERQARWRWWVVGGGALVLAVALALLLTVAPSWWRWPLLAGAVLLFAKLGRPADRPITDRVTNGPRFVKLTAEMVRSALCQLSIADMRDPAALTFPPPGIHRDGPGWLARVNLPGGVEAVTVLERRRKLSSALRLPLDQVWPAVGPEHEGQLDLWVGYAPASKMGQPRWSLLDKTARTSVFTPHPFATDERQRPVMVTLFERNFLVGGAPGSGKSFGARSLVSIALLDPTCELKIAEFKGTGDFLDMAPLCTTYVCGVDDESLRAGGAIIRWGIAEAERRGKRIKALRSEAPDGKVTPELAARRGSGLHPVVIALDEVHELFSFDPEAAELAERLIKRGRALGIILILATQIPDSKSVPPNITRCVTVRWCMAVLGQVENDMILGTGAYKRGLAATAYRPGEPPEGDAGWGITVGLPKAGAARSYFPSPEQRAELVARATALRGGVVGGDQGAVTHRDILADAAAVIGQGNGAHWEALAAALAELAPEAYGDDTAATVSERLRALGVDSVDVKVQGVTRKGVRRAAVTDALANRSTAIR